MPEFEAVIGLEVHAQLRTATKIFCSCEVRFGAPPNSLTCPVCLGMPGALPVLNRHAVELALRMALAVGCEIRPTSVFARKNYFYPDLPKGYQISQYELPLAEHGRLAVGSGERRREVRIRRVHMEEDAGKLIHEGPLAVEDASIVDFNRAGVPLIEIVGDPDLTGPEEAYDYLTGLKSLLTYTEVCDGNMEEGSLRCDANVSLREKGAERLGTRVELKNLNSFRNVERALRYEISRQEKVLRSGGRVVQETLLYDASAGTTRPMRSKEEAHDYRYFPDPDLLPLVVHEAWIDQVRVLLPELPSARKDRFRVEYSLSEPDAQILTLEKPLADYFEAAVFGGDALPPAAAGSGARTPLTPPKEIAKRILREVMTKMKEEGISSAELAARYPAGHITELVRLQQAGTVNGPTAAEVFEFSWIWAAGECRPEQPSGGGRGAAHASDEGRPSEKTIRLAGFGLRRPLAVVVPAGGSLRVVLREADVAEEQARSLVVGIDGRIVESLDGVPPDGAVVTGAAPVQGASASPGAVSASPESIVGAFGLGQISDEVAIRRAVEEAIGSSPAQVEQYRDGKQAVYGYFVGQVMRAMGGRANPALVNRLLKERLSKSE